MNNRLWILGASDPEMQAIEALLAECGEAVAHATHAGQRVHPRIAYEGSAVIPVGVTDVYLVECDVPTPEGVTRHVIDHHRPGDPGYGRPPAEFLAASSIGQVIAELARCGAMLRLAYDRWWPYHQPAEYECQAGVLYAHPDPHRVSDAAVWRVCIEDPDASYIDKWCRHGRSVQIPLHLVLAAAADHCLGAAYRGECPGVNTDALMRWRVASRAAFQGVDPSAIMAAVETARAALRQAPLLKIKSGSHCGAGSSHYSHGSCGCGEQSYGSGHPHASTSWGTGDCYCECDGCRTDVYAIWVVDMRRPAPIPELPEAATRDGVAYVSGPLIDARDPGRAKYTVSGPADVVCAWMESWAPTQGMVGIYGDPARGFAGGYLPVDAV